MTPSWHADYLVFPGTGTCDNGLLLWIPFEKSEYDNNGLKLIPGSHKLEELTVNNP